MRIIWNVLEVSMKLSDADYLRLRRAIALEQLIVRSVPFDRPLAAARTLASSVDITTVVCRGTRSNSNGASGCGTNGDAERTIDR
jgi:hypothetical protein